MEFGVGIRMWVHIVWYLQGSQAYGAYLMRSQVRFCHALTFFMPKTVLIHELKITGKASCLDKLLKVHSFNLIILQIVGDIQKHFWQCRIISIPSSRWRPNVQQCDTPTSWITVKKYILRVCMKNFRPTITRNYRENLFS